MNSIKTGKITDISENYKGWFIGPFADKHPEFKNDHFEMKWSKLPKDYISEPKTQVEEGKSTMGILMYGKYTLEFIDPEEKIILQNEGDYVFYNPNLPHRGTALEGTLLLTIRWPSQ